MTSKALSLFILFCLVLFGCEESKPIETRELVLSKCHFDFSSYEQAVAISCPSPEACTLCGRPGEGGFLCITFDPRECKP